MDDALAYFLELRVRLRKDGEARAIVDRCLALIARAKHADAATLIQLQKEVDQLADELAQRFGAPATAVLN